LQQAGIFQLAKGSSHFRSSMSDEFLMKSKQYLPWLFANREFCA